MKGGISSAIAVGCVAIAGFIGFSQESKKMTGVTSHIIEDSISVRLKETLDSLRNDNINFVDHIVQKNEVLDSVVKEQSEEIVSLEKDVKIKSGQIKKLKTDLDNIQSDTIIIRDTITIKESRNFWGRTKRDTI